MNATTIIILLTLVVLLIYSLYMMRRNDKIYHSRMIFIYNLLNRAFKGELQYNMIHYYVGLMSYSEMMSIRNSFKPIPKLIDEWEERIQLYKDIKKP